MSYSIRTNILKESKQTNKRVVEVDQVIDDAWRMKIEAQIQRLQKALEQGRFKRKELQEVEESVLIRDGEKREGDYKTFAAAQKKAEGRPIDYYDGSEWHEGVKKEMNVK